MSYCLNPKCLNPSDPANANRRTCCNCGSELFLQGRYRVIQALGGGGFGKTFEVDDRGVRKVLKVLFKEHPKAIELFQQEARVLSRLSHPGIPRVEDDGYFTYIPAGSKSTFHCLVMEKIEGANLQDWLKSRGNKPISQEEALDWLKQLTEILDQVHKLQYFHRDIKPHNIMRRPNGQLVLIDFGTAREVSGTYLVKVGQGQNVTGIVSPGYTPPEQSNGKAVPQSDFYALGRTFVFLLTGKPPTAFPENPRSGKLMWRKGTQNLSSDLADVIDYLMAPFPGNRPQNPQMILQCLSDIHLDQEPANYTSGNTGFTKQRGTTGFTSQKGLSTGSQTLTERRQKQWWTRLNPMWVKRGGISILIGLLSLSQIYGYVRYGFLPSNPLFLLASLPSSGFLEKTIKGKVGKVNSLAISSNGQFLLSGSFGAIRVWDMSTGEQLNVIYAHNEAVNSLAISPNSRIVVSGSADRLIRLWNLQNGTRRLTIAGHNSAVNTVAISPDGKLVASGSDDQLVRLWSVSNGARIRTLQGHRGAVTQIAFSPDGRLLASASQDKTIRIWNLSNGSQRFSLLGHTQNINTIAFSPDGKVLASGSDDRTIRLWDVQTGKLQSQLKRSATKVTALAFTPDGKTLISGGDDQVIKLWDLKTGQQLNSFRGHTREITEIVVHPDGNLIITGSLDKTIKIWNRAEQP